MQSALKVFRCDRVPTKKEGGAAIAIPVCFGLDAAMSESIPFPSECQLLYVGFAYDKMFHLIVAHCPSRCTASEIDWRIAARKNISFVARSP